VSRATKGLSTGKTARFAGFALPLSFTKTHRESRAAGGSERVALTLIPD